MTTGADWLETARRVVDTFLAPPVAASPTTGPATTAGEEAVHGATGHADTCRWCPVCQAVAVARGERPEVTAALADLLTTTAGALRTFAESGPQHEHQHHTAAAAGGESTDDPGEDDPPARTVQRIDIG